MEREGEEGGGGGVLTDSERRKSSLILDQFGPAVPSLGNEVMGLLVGGLDCRGTKSPISISILSNQDLDGLTSPNRIARHANLCVARDESSFNSETFRWGDTGAEGQDGRQQAHRLVDSAVQVR